MYKREILPIWLETSVCDGADKVTKLIKQKEKAITRVHKKGHEKIKTSYEIVQTQWLHCNLDKYSYLQFREIAPSGPSGRWVLIAFSEIFITKSRNKLMEKEGNLAHNSHHFVQ